MPIIIITNILTNFFVSLFKERFLAGTVVYSDDSESDSDDDEVKQNEPSMSYPAGKVKKSHDFIGMGRCLYSSPKVIRRNC